MIDYKYKDLITTILEEGYDYEDPNRTGVIRKEIPSYTIKHMFKEGFPAITLKKLAFKTVVTELIWFLRGDTNIKYLVDNGCNIWNKDAYNYYVKKCKIYDIEPWTIEEFIYLIKRDGAIEHGNISDYKLGDLGKVYGHYWRDFNGVDQIRELLHDMINKPMSSELLVVARDPSHKEEQALPCCHYGFQIVMRPLFNDICDEIDYLEKIKIVSKKDLELWDILAEKNANDLEFRKILDKYDYPKYGFELHWKQRSVDTFLGLPFNIASYALLALILEKITGHKALGIQGDLKKVHLYDNSLEAAKELITRKCSEEKIRVLYKDEFHYITDSKLVGKVPINEIINHMKPDWFQLENYNPQEPLKIEMLSRD